MLMKVEMKIVTKEKRVIVMKVGMSIESREQNPDKSGDKKCHERKARDCYKNGVDNCDVMKVGMRIERAVGGERQSTVTVVGDGKTARWSTGLQPRCCRHQQSYISGKLSSVS